MRRIHGDLPVWRQVLAPQRDPQPGWVTGTGGLWPGCMQANCCLASWLRLAGALRDAKTPDETARLDSHANATGDPKPNKP